MRDRTSKIFLTFFPTLALRRIDRKLSQIKIPLKRHLFREMVQGEIETIDQLAVRLRQKDQPCQQSDHGNQIEAQIRDQIISNCRSKELGCKLLEKVQTLTFKLL